MILAISCQFEARVLLVLDDGDKLGCAGSWGSSSVIMLNRRRKGFHRSLIVKISGALEFVELILEAVDEAEVRTLGCYVAKH